jgi:hypothetical protein
VTDAKPPVRGRTWHRDEATTGTDDQVAAELEAAAELARTRGGYSEQALFLSRAADLLVAAQAEIAAGQGVQKARHLLAPTDRLTTGSERAEQSKADPAAPKRYPWQSFGHGGHAPTRLAPEVEPLYGIEP